MAEAEKDDWLDDLESPEEKSAELDQSDIDSLLSDSFGPGPAAVAPPPPSADEGLELDQSAIDALLSGSDGVVSPGAKGMAADSGDLDQSDIDALLAGPKVPAQNQSPLEPDQDEIDKLFADVDAVDQAEETPFPTSDEIDFKDVFDTPSAATGSGKLDFDADDFKLDVDIPDIPDTKGEDFAMPSFMEETVVTPRAPEPPQPVAPAPEKVKPRAEEPVRQDTPVKKVSFAFLRNRKVLLGVGLGLLVLLSVAGVYFVKGKKLPHAAPPQADTAHAPAAVEQHKPAATPSAPPPPEPPKPELAQHNGAPTVADLDLSIPPGSTQVPVTLTGKDPENEPLLYEFQSMPEHGQLSGHPPNLVYTPRPDFGGTDGFTVRATDGKNFSAPATVRISRPEPVAAKEPPPKATVASETPAATAPKKTEVPVKAKPATVAAKNKSYTVTNSKGQLISWDKIWREGNSSPYNPGVQVDIVKGPLHGVLSPVNKQQSLYKPTRAYNGTDAITYRFKQGKRVSQSKTITLAVHHQNKAPVIHLQPLAPSYATGDTVILNATQTSDEERASLTFRWEQLAGVHVVLKPVAKDGSQVAFVVPSTFNTVKNPGVRLRVTVTDEDGAQDSKEVKVTTKSRRQSAIWRSQD